MEWIVKYDNRKEEKPWGVFRHAEGRKLFEDRFETEEEARYYADKKEKHFARPQGDKAGRVEEASVESFPASDAPAWTKMATGADAAGLRNKRT